MAKRTDKSAVARWKSFREARGLSAASTAALADLLASTPPDNVLREARAAGITMRRAYYFRTISAALQARYLTADQIRTLGWTKAQNLARNALQQQCPITDEDVNSARRVTKAERATDGTASRDPVRMIFTLSKAQCAVVVRALQAFGALASSPMHVRVRALHAMSAAALVTKRRKKAGEGGMQRR